MRKITILAFLFLSITICMIGQENKLSVGLISSIGSNKFYFKETGFNYEYKSDLEFSFGIGFHYYVLKKVFINTGIAYLTNGYHLKYNYVFRDPGDPLIPRQSDLIVKYLKVPIIIGVQLFETQRIRFNPSLGINLFFKTNETGTTVYEDNTERDSELISQDLNKTIVLLNLGFGLEYYLNERFTIGFEPYLGKGLNRLADKSMSSGQFSYGGILGIFYKF
jgi:hypothetical protein